MSNETFYMVYLEGFNSPKFKHESARKAREEAKRLTQLHGVPAYVLKAIKKIEKLKFVETDLIELPF